MTLWLARSGKHGEYEERFLDEARIYLTWDELRETDLSKADSHEKIKAILERVYPNESKGRITNWAGQISVFRAYMQVGDLFIMPLKHKPAIAIGTIESTYIYDPKAPAPYKHYRRVKWLNKEIPRQRFDQDLLYSFGAFMTFCEIKRNDAEARVKAILGKKSAIIAAPTKNDEIPSETYAPRDILALAQDQLANFIIRKFKGHGLERLVEAVLKAQGYTTFHSPKGGDGGKDILVASGNLGFGDQRICVQVKSGQDAEGMDTYDALIRTMDEVKAPYGLLVAWGGVKSAVEKKRGNKFFSIRFWNQDDLIQQIQLHYDKLDDDIKAELPLKRIWVVTEIEE